MFLDPVCQTCLENASVTTRCIKCTRTHPNEPHDQTSLYAMLTLIPSGFVERSVCAQSVDPNDDVGRRKVETESCPLEVGRYWR